MGMLDEILNSQNGAVLKQLSSQFGISDGDSKNVLTNLLPAIKQGIKNNASKNGVEGLFNALKNGAHGQYLDNPASLSEQGSVDDGNKILGHIFGNKETSREVAQQAAKNTGLDAGLLKKMLPVVAALGMGMVGKKANEGGLLGSLLGGGLASLGGMLSGSNNSSMLGALGSLLNDGDDDNAANGFNFKDISKLLG